MYILNTQVFGKLLPPPGSKDHVYDEAERLLFLRMEAMSTIGFNFCFVFSFCFVFVFGSYSEPPDKYPFHLGRFTGYVEYNASFPALTAPPYICVYLYTCNICDIYTLYVFSLLSLVHFIRIDTNSIDRNRMFILHICTVKYAQLSGIGQQFDNSCFSSFVFV